MDAIILNILGAFLAITSSAIAGWLYIKSLKRAETPRTDKVVVSKQAVGRKRIRILVVEDESVVRDGLVSILSLSPDIKIVGEAANGIDAINLVEKTRPDVVLLDMVMPEMDGLSAIPKIMEKLPTTKILVLTSFAESDRVYQAIKEGALGYMLKDATREQLLVAIRDVAKGQATIQPEIAGKVIQQISRTSKEVYSSEPLSARETEILQSIAHGLSNQEIAKKLSIQERTVATYVVKILDKLHLANRTQAALYAIREETAEEAK